MGEIGASEGEKSILIASHESNPGQFSTFLEIGSWLHSKHSLLGTPKKKTLSLASYLFAAF